MEKEQLLNRAQVAELIGKSVAWINKELNPKYRHPQYNFPFNDGIVGETRLWRRATIEQWLDTQFGRRGS